MELNHKIQQQHKRIQGQYQSELQAQMGQSESSNLDELLNDNHAKSNICQILKNYKPFTNKNRYFSSVDKNTKFIVFQSNPINYNHNENSTFDQGISKDNMSHQIALNKQYFDKIYSKNNSQAFSALIKYYQLRQNILNKNQQQENNILKLLSFQINQNNNETVYPNRKIQQKIQTTQKSTLISSSCRLENLFQSKSPTQLPTIQKKNLYRIDFLHQFQPNTLQKQLSHRLNLKQSFKQRQIWSIIYCTAQAANKMITYGLKEPMLSPKTIFINQNSSIKVGEWEFVNYYQNLNQSTSIDQIGSSFYQEGETIVNVNSNLTFNVNTGLTPNTHNQNQSIFSLYYWPPQGIVSIQNMIKLGQLNAINSQVEIKNNQVFSLGMSVLSMLSLKAYYQKSTFRQRQLKSLIQNCIAHREDINQPISSQLSYLLQKMLQWDPLQRFCYPDIIIYVQKTYQQCKQIFDLSQNQQNQQYGQDNSQERELQLKNQYVNSMYTQMSVNLQSEERQNLQSQERQNLQFNSNYKPFQTQYFSKATLKQIDFNGSQAIFQHNDDYQPQFQQYPNSIFIQQYPNTISTQQYLNTIFTHELKYDVEDQLNYIQCQNTQDIDELENPDEDLQQTNISKNSQIYSNKKQTLSPLQSIQNLVSPKYSNFHTFFKQKNSSQMQKQNNSKNKLKQSPNSSYNLIKVKQIISPCSSKQSNNQCFNQVKYQGNMKQSITKVHTHTNDHLFTDPYLMAIIKQFSAKSFNINSNLNLNSNFNTASNFNPKSNFNTDSYFDINSNLKTKQYLNLNSNDIEQIHKYQRTPSFDFIQQKQKCQTGIETNYRSQRLFKNQINADNNQKNFNFIDKSFFCPKKQTFSQIKIKDQALNNKLNLVQRNPLSSTSLQIQVSLQRPQIITQQFSLGYYHGEKLNNFRHGYGCFYYKQGGKYEGNWYKNQMQGHGKLYYQDGRIAYDGQWLDDSLHGNGILYNQYPKPLKTTYNYTSFQQCQTLEFWTYYQGQFQNDQKSGQGQLLLSNGEKYVGHFANDMVHGYGSFYKTDGTIVRAQWQYNHIKQ